MAYKLGTHAKERMLRRFHLAKTYKATFSAVRAALPQGTDPKDIMAYAAHVWYVRSNRRKYLYCGAETVQDWADFNDFYKNLGVYPVSAERLATIKPSTITKIKEILYA